MDDLFVVDTKGSKGNSEKKTAEKGAAQKKGAKPVKKAKNAVAAAEAASHEAEWERILFGAGADADEDDKEAEELAPTSARSGGDDSDADDTAPAHGKSPSADKTKRAVWCDDDDDNVRIDLSGKDRLRKLRKSEDETAVTGPQFAERVRERATVMSNAVTWATRKKSRKEEEGQALLRSGAPLTGKRSSMLPAAALEVERLKDANFQDVSDSVVQSVRFHPNSQLLLTASLDKRLKIFQIDGKNNSKVQGVHFEDLPIQYAEFSADGSEVLVSGRRKFFYVYNLAGASVSKVQGVLGSSDKFLGAMIPSPDSSFIASLGTCGHVGLLSGKSKQWIGELKMNCDVTCGVFGTDGLSLYTAGKSSLIYHWDLRMRRCVKKIVDEGSLHISSLALSSTNILAVGSQTGVVNTYDVNTFSSLPIDDFADIRPATRKAVMNLTTGISLLTYNGDGQMLLMASQAKKDALRILHTNSSNVFPNWPTSGTPLHAVSTAAFSPNNRYMAMGNDRGKVLLYRLKHYS